MSKSMEEHLTGEFEEHLDRPLSQKEKAFIRWIASKANHEKNKRLHAVNDDEKSYPNIYKCR